MLHIKCHCLSFEILHIDLIKWLKAGCRLSLTCPSLPWSKAASMAVVGPSSTGPFRLGATSKLGLLAACCTDFRLGSRTAAACERHDGSKCPFGMAFPRWSTRTGTVTKWQGCGGGFSWPNGLATELLVSFTSSLLGRQLQGDNELRKRCQRLHFVHFTDSRKFGSWHVHRSERFSCSLMLGGEGGSQDDVLTLFRVSVTMLNSRAWDQIWKNTSKYINLYMQWWTNISENAMVLCTKIRVRFSSDVRNSTSRNVYILGIVGQIC